MSKNTKFLLVSLPTSVSPADSPDEALTALRSTITNDNGQTYRFPLPTFKIGTLDALVQQAEDLSKLESACEGVVSKVADSLKTLMDGDEDKMQQHKTVNDSRQTCVVVGSVIALMLFKGPWINICKSSSGTRSSIGQIRPLVIL